MYEEAGEPGDKPICPSGRPPYPYTTTVGYGDQTQIAAVISECIVLCATWTTTA